MGIKKIHVPTFEEWLENGKKYRGEFGSYCYEVKAFCSGSKVTTYIFAVFLATQKTLNAFTNTIFCRGYDDYGNIEKLKKWYDDTIKEFNSFWFGNT